LVLQQAKDYDKAREAFEKAATGHQRQGSPWNSAKSLEKAADMAKQCRSGGLDVEALYRDAASGYMEAGRTTAAAEALARAALHLEGLDAKVYSTCSRNAALSATAVITCACGKLCCVFC
jgi:tetratricopeptide (TPR) repeat protein